MKKETDENNELTPYNIGVSHLRKSLTIKDVLLTVFSYEIHDIAPNEGPEIVNESFLLNLAYGIYGIGSFNPEKCDWLEPSLVKAEVFNMIKLYPSRANSARIFLKHFEKATEAFGENGIQRTAKRTLKRIDPVPDYKPLSFFPKSETSEQITAMYHDLQLLQLNLFMKVMYDTISTGKAIPDVNCIVENSRQLYELIKSDITLSPTKSKKKISIYLQVAYHLLENPNIVDLPSISVISLVLSTLPNKCLSKNDELSKKINSLAETMSPNNHFRNVKEIMETKLCIPHYIATKKGLDVLKETNVFNQLILLGQIYHTLFNTFNALQTHIEVTKIFYPKYHTNLSSLLENADKILQEHEDIKTQELNEKNAAKNKRASIRMPINLALSLPKEFNLNKAKNQDSSEVPTNNKNEEQPNKASQAMPEPKPTIQIVDKETKTSNSFQSERIKSFKKRSATFSHHAVYKEPKEPLEKRSSSLSPLQSPSESSLNNNSNEIHTNGENTDISVVMIERRISPKSLERRLAYNNSRGKDQLNPNGFFESAEPELNIHEKKNEMEMEKKGC